MVRHALPLVLAAGVLVGCGSGGDDTGTRTTATASPPRATKPTVAVPKGPPPRELVVRDLRKGTGRVARPGDTVRVQYVGVLYRNGRQFDASWDRGQPFSFVLQANEVIPGWDQGLEGMRVGGRRELIVPARLAYGARGQGPIPPNAPLVFVVDLLAVS